LRAKALTTKGTKLTKDEKGKDQTSTDDKPADKMEIVATPAPKKVVPKEPIPSVEWWDKFLLPNENHYLEQKEIDKIKLDEVTFYIEHPVQLKPTGEDEVVIPMFLTKKEQKKLRRRTRMEREKEKQEKVLLGIQAAPKPKVKISNLMRVMGAEATSDPTKIEQEVRKQMAERVANHEARNLSRKLTKDEQKDKKKKKLEKDAKLSLQVAVFRVNDLSNPRNKFKVDINAKELQLTGCVILHKNTNLIVVEGGSKAVRKFKKVLLNRMDWNRPLEDKEEKEEKKRRRTKRGSINSAVSIDLGGYYIESQFPTISF